jgi:hypothetical protein
MVRDVCKGGMRCAEMHVEAVCGEAYSGGLPAVRIGNAPAPIELCWACAESA